MKAKEIRDAMARDCVFDTYAGEHSDWVRPLKELLAKAEEAEEEPEQLNPEQAWRIRHALRSAKEGNARPCRQWVEAALTRHLPPTCSDRLNAAMLALNAGELIEARAILERLLKKHWRSE